jgi:hypothetical protein
MKNERVGRRERDAMRWSERKI